MSTKSVHIDHLRIRVPHCSEEEARALGRDVATEIASLSRQGVSMRSTDKVSIRVSSQPHEGRRAMAQRIARKLAEEL